MVDDIKMTSFKCANCGAITDLPKKPKKFVCSTCGVLNTPATEMVADEACGCILPTGFEWKLPAGEFDTPNGKLFSTADDGTMLTREEWISIFGSDPVIASEWMKKAKDGKPGFFKIGGKR